MIQLRGRVAGAGTFPLAVATAVLGGAAGLLAVGLDRWSAAPLVALGVTAALVGVVAAYLRPGLLLGVLLLFLLCQDGLVGIGLKPAQYADEGLVLALAVGLALRALRASWRPPETSKAVGAGHPDGRATGLPSTAPLESDRPLESGMLLDSGSPLTAISRRHESGMPLTAVTPLDVPTLGFLAAGLASAALNQVPAVVAGLGLLAILKGLLAFQLFARTCLDPRAVRKVLAVLAALVVAAVGVAVAQRVGGETVFGWMGRLAYFTEWQGGKAPSVFSHHNAFGHVTVLCGALALGLALTGRGPERRLWGWVTLACLVGLLVSASRESWVAAAAGLAAAAVVMRSRRLTRIALLTTLVLIIGGALVYLSSPLMRAEVARRTDGLAAGWHDYELGFTGMEYRGEYRVYVILKSWSIFQEQPWLGTGPGRFGGHVAEVFPSPVYDRYDFQPLHESYLPLDVFWSRLLTESGLLGAGCFLLAFLASGQIFLRGCRATDPLLRGLALGGLMAWVAVAVFGFFSPVLEDALVAVPIWGWAGGVWGLGLRSVGARIRAATD